MSTGNTETLGPCVIMASGVAADEPAVAEAEDWGAELCVAGGPCSWDAMTILCLYFEAAKKLLLGKQYLARLRTLPLQCDL